MCDVIGNIELLEEKKHQINFLKMHFVEIAYSIW